MFLEGMKVIAGHLRGVGFERSSTEGVPEAWLFAATSNTLTSENRVVGKLLGI